MSKIRFERGGLYLAQLPEIVGSIQTGIRPVLVMSNTLNNIHSPTVTIIPLTTQIKADIPTHIDLCGFNLKKTSTLLCEAIMTIDKESFIKHIGDLDEETLTKVEKRIAIQLGLKLAPYNEQ